MKTMLIVFHSLTGGTRPRRRGSLEDAHGSSVSASACPSVAGVPTFGVIAQRPGRPRRGFLKH